MISLDSVSSQSARQTASENKDVRSVLTQSQLAAGADITEPGEAPHLADGLLQSDEFNHLFSQNIMMSLITESAKVESVDIFSPEDDE
ncbi:hypothetical protein [Biostraticola tofi]|uniref:Uncharacterized protein n=1 Tax=Biostraticola tofi TaxID=466109 RepID=A0A4R3YW27_9GAMM|nr:hypothetical protein [Biostraticola tofi]TCV96686.1 hypothetical protein EDC52_104126 [Biostraticola tofi]